MVTRSPHYAPLYNAGPLISRTSNSTRLWFITELARIAFSQPRVGALLRNSPKVDVTSQTVMDGTWASELNF